MDKQWLALSLTLLFMCSGINFVHTQDNLKSVDYLSSISKWDTHDKHSSNIEYPPKGKLPVLKNKSLEFKWSGTKENSNFKLLLFNAKKYKKRGLRSKVLFSVNTKENKYTLKHPSSYLKEGMQYVYIIIDENIFKPSSSKENRISQPVYFYFEPDCDPPYNVNAQIIRDAVVNVTWNDIEASFNGPRYVIRYRFLKDGRAKVQWIEEWILEGQEHLIDTHNDIHADQIEVEIKRICDGQGYTFELESEWVPINNIDLNNEDNARGGSASISLGDFECGEIFQLPYNTNEISNPLITATINDTFIVAGFPMYIESFTPIPPSTVPPETVTGWGYYSGIGLIPLPFGGQIVRVEFDNVFINTFYQMEAGTVYGIYDDPSNYPEIFNLDPANFGGEICITPPPSSGFDENGIYQPDGTPYDPNGFNEDGTYSLQPPYPGWQVGMPFDSLYNPCGFDANGIHVVTGTLYSENGCNMQGFDENNQPCNSSPCQYYWVEDNELTEEGVEFSEMVQDSILPYLKDALNTMKATNQDSLTTTINRCGNTRTDMNQLVGTLGFQRLSIFGPNDIFFKEGMHEQFASTPEPLEANIASRNSDIIALEQKHIELFHCDKMQFVFQRLDSIITTELTNDLLLESEETILEILRSLSAAQIDQIQNTIGLANWIFNYMASKIEATYNENYDSIGATEQPNQKTETLCNVPSLSSPLRFSENTSINIGTWQASNKDKNFTVDKLETISFEYKQGWKKVNGMHRALFVDAMSKARYNSVNAPDSTLLPIKVSREINGRDYNVYFDNIVFNASVGTATILFVFDIPSSENHMIFSIDNVEFTPTGFTEPDFRISLDSDVSFKLNNASKLTIKGNAKTYVNLDCNGFSGMGIDAEVEFCRKYLIPLDPMTLDTLQDEEERVKGYFSTSMLAWGEVVTRIDITPFAIAKVADIARCK